MVPSSDAQSADDLLFSLLLVSCESLLSGGALAYRFGRGITLPIRGAMGYNCAAMSDAQQSSGVRAAIIGLVAMLAVLSQTGCATIRVTDPGRTATEQFLMSEAVIEAIEQLSAAALRDRLVYLDGTYLAGMPQQEVSFLMGEIRARLLLEGVRLVETREQADIILEPRSGGVGVDRTEFLLGIPAIYIPTAASSVGANAPPITTPELAIVKRTTQRGFAGVAFVAYWRDSGELVVSSGPFIGRTLRQDYWFFGTGPQTVGNIPTTRTPQ